MLEPNITYLNDIYCAFSDLIRGKDLLIAPSKISKFINRYTFNLCLIFTLIGILYIMLINLLV